jgi:SAM-dependent methyltransferase
LVQTEDYAQVDELFSADYAYFSSTSTGWMNHAKAYTSSMIERFQLSTNSHVIEIASNDGYLLKNFVTAGIPCLGIEPTASTAAAAEKLGIPVLHEFFGEVLGKQLATKQRQADLIAGNNVYAHVPDINDFTRGLKAALKPNGTITLEFPHLMRLIEHTQFDTVYHEHFSYLSLYTAGCVFKAAGLRIWDVDQLPTHGGSLRIYGCHAEDARTRTEAVSTLLAEEAQRGLQTLETYQKFQIRADKVKNDLLTFLVKQNRAGKKVAAYGAAAKGNTLLNYAGIKSDLLPFVCDAAAAKQGKYMPGSHIPILAPSALAKSTPDYVLILPWNITAEVKQQNAALAAQGTKFVTAVPELNIT